MVASLARLLSLRGMRFADRRGGGSRGGGTGTCAVLETAHHHRACERREERGGSAEIKTKRPTKQGENT